MLISFPTTHYHISSYSARYTFSGKERDEETGYSYFGARYYNSSYSIWLSVDPMSDKYPSLSPYAYCGNNPVKLVDPNGMEIVISGNDGDHTYTPGSQCNSSDKNVQDAWNNLNIMYATKAGKTVIGEMTADGAPTFTLTNESLKNDGTARFKADGKGGGTLYMGGKLKESSYVAHELFHGYQEMKGQGGTSIHNEVEANLFAFLTTNRIFELGPKNDSSFQTRYGQSFKAFSLNKVNASNFDLHFGTLRNGFISNSIANFDGIYSKFPLGNNNKPLLKQFF